MAGPEERQLAAQHVDGQGVGRNQVVLNFAKRIAGGLLNPPRHEPVFGMGQQELRQGLGPVPARKGGGQRCRHPPGVDRQFQRGADLHALAAGFALASLGFGLFRPGFTAGASQAVSRAEQGQSAGVVASVNGAAYIVAPAIAVWIYNHWEWLAFGIIAALMAATLLVAWRGTQRDAELLGI